MKLLTMTRKSLTQACCLFTGVMLVYFLITSTFLEEPGITAPDALLFLGFSIVFAFANRLFSIPISKIWTTLLHLIVTSVDLILFFFVFTDYYVDHGGFVVGATVAYAFFYLLVVFVTWFLKNTKKKPKEQSEKDYQPLYE